MKFLNLSTANLSKRFISDPYNVNLTFEELMASWGQQSPRFLNLIRDSMDIARLHSSDVQKFWDDIQEGKAPSFAEVLQCFERHDIDPESWLNNWENRMCRYLDFFRAFLFVNLHVAEQAESNSQSDVEGHKPDANRTHVLPFNLHRCDVPQALRREGFKKIVTIKNENHWKLMEALMAAFPNAVAGTKLKHIFEGPNDRDNYSRALKSSIEPLGLTIDQWLLTDTKQRP